MYIAFEGIVGAGKTTQVQRLVEYFTSRGDAVVHVREPGATPIAEDIRILAQVQHWQDDEMHPLTNAYLYAAARSQTLHTVVKQALENKKIVISDRCFLSSVAYQGEAQWLGFDTVLSVNSEAIAGLIPDKVLYMDIDINTALARTFDTAWDKWENMGRAFFEKIIHGYNKCEDLPMMQDRFIRIDANRSEDSVFESIIQSLTESWAK